MDHSCFGNHGVSSLIRGLLFISHRNGYLTKLLPETHPLYSDSLAFDQAIKAEWQIKTTDGLRLRAWYLPAELTTNKTVILATGYNSVREHFFSIAWLFHRLNYHVLMPEMRASTEAEGCWVGFGWLDKEDFKLWMNQVLEKNPVAEIAFWGVSMGAATIMMLSGEDLPANVKCFIEDCGYDSVWNEMKHQVRHYHLPIWPLLPMMNFYSRAFAGYDWWEASSVKQLVKNTRPILFIHGKEDDFVPFDMLAKNVAASRSAKEVLVVQKARHAMAYETDIPLYQKTVREFLEEYF